MMPYDVFSMPLHARVNIFFIIIAYDDKMLTNNLVLYQWEPNQTSKPLDLRLNDV